MESAHKFIDFFDASAFIVGSTLFLYEDWQTIAAWFFIADSALAASKPTIRTIREVKLSTEDDTDDLAAMEKEE